MKEENEINEKWLSKFYDRVSEQFTLSRTSFHSTHQWAITLTFGIVTAILTFSNEFDPYPNEIGFVALLLTLPLMIRFFIRSCLEYAIEKRWEKIRNNLDNYYYNKNNNNKNKLLKSIDDYYFNWKSPISIWKNIFDNLRLAYAWPFLLYIGLISWGATSLYWHSSLLIQISVLSVSIFVIIEISSFFCYPGLRKK